MNEEKTREFQTQLLHYFSKSDNKSNHHHNESFDAYLEQFLSCDLIHDRMIHTNPDTDNECSRKKNKKKGPAIGKTPNVVFQHIGFRPYDLVL